MTIPRDYYEVLGVPRDADTTTIKDAFRQLARRYHPDISTEPDAEQRFKETAEAYGVLSDPAKRASYDAQGSAGLAGATAEDLWDGIDFADIFGPGAGAFGSLFWRLFPPSAWPFRWPHRPGRADRRCTPGPGTAGTWSPGGPSAGRGGWLRPAGRSRRSPGSDAKRCRAQIRCLRTAGTDPVGGS